MRSALIKEFTMRKYMQKKADISIYYENSE